MTDASLFSTPDLARAREIEDQLLQAEDALALFDSLTPVNLASETNRIERLLAQGRAALPDLVHRDQRLLASRAHQADAVLASVRRELDFRSRDSVLRRLLAERADELAIEVNLVRTCGSEDFRPWARQRFEFSEHEMSRAAMRAQEWVQEDLPGAGEEPSRPLASELQRLAREREVDWGLNVVVIERPLASVAAVGGDAVYVRQGARVSLAEAERIFVHEVEGHLLPRLRSRSGPPPFRIGTSGSATDEEGRAILLEERCGALLAGRRVELGVRFFIGVAAQQSEEMLVEEVRRLLGLGIPPGVLASTLTRAMRGGGLGREKIYIPSYQRVRDALLREPRLEAWMERGRISIRSARELLAAWAPG